MNIRTVAYIDLKILELYYTLLNRRYRYPRPRPRPRPRRTLVMLLTS
jgi:hypothetical protein